MKFYTYFCTLFNFTYVALLDTFSKISHDYFEARRIIQKHRNPVKFYAFIKKMNAINSRNEFDGCPKRKSHIVCGALTEKHVLQPCQQQAATTAWCNIKMFTGVNHRLYTFVKWFILFFLGCIFTKFSYKMSIYRSGTITRSAGVVSQISKQLRIMNLKAVKRVTITFDPFTESAIAAR